MRSGGEPRSVTSYATVYPSRAEHVANVIRASACYDTGPLQQILVDTVPLTNTFK
jgi:hypothetical protein